MAQGRLKVHSCPLARDAQGHPDPACSLQVPFQEWSQDTYLLEQCLLIHPTPFLRANCWSAISPLLQMQWLL